MKKLISFTFLFFFCISVVCSQWGGKVNKIYPYKGDNMKWGLKNQDDVIIMESKYDSIYNLMSDGFAIVRLNGKYGFIDHKTGLEIVNLIYDKVTHFDYSSGSGNLAQVMVNKKWGFIDKTGKKITQLIYDEVGYFKYDYALVALNGKYGFIDKTGKEVIALKYDWTLGFSSNGLATVRLNEKYGFIDKTGKEVVALKYNLPTEFSEGLARVKLESKFGYIDQTGKEVIPIIYDKADYLFKGGKASVTIAGRSFYIDKTGKELSQ